MPESYRPPKNVLAERDDLPASLTADQVAELRSAGGATGEWAARVIDGLLERSTIKEKPMLYQRAEGADIPLSDALAALLGEEFELYCRAQEAHWNVTGPDFSEYHALFQSIYEDAYSSVDPIAENLRKIGSLTPSLVVTPAEDRQTDPAALAASLLEDSVELGLSCRAAFDIATAAGQQGIANFLAERQDAHALWAWQLRSSLGIAEVGESPAEDVIEVDDMTEDASEDEMPMEVDSADVDDLEARRSMIDAADKRVFTTEVRAAKGDDGMIRMSGYAAMFDREADGLPFREVIKPGAFRSSLERGDDVFLLVNHDTDALPLARRSAGTLDVSEDETGLRVDAVLDPANPRAAELASALDRGDVDKMSFAFRVAEGGQSRNAEGVRELTSLDLFEVSVVTWPAYSATTVGTRSADDEDEQPDVAARWLRAKWDHYRNNH